MIQTANKACLSTLLILLIISSVAACSSKSTATSLISTAESADLITTLEVSTPFTPTVTESARLQSTAVTPPSIKAEIKPTINGTLLVDQIEEPHLLAILGKYEANISDESTFSFAADGKSFIMQDANRLYIWRTSPLKEIRSVSLDMVENIQQIALSEDNHYAAALSLDSANEIASLQIWHVMKSEAIHQLELGSIHEDQVVLIKQSPVWISHQLAFIPGTNKIACKTNSLVTIFDTENGDSPVSIPLREDMTAQKITFTRDGRFMYVLLYSLSSSNLPYYLVQIWDTSTFQLRESVAVEEPTANVEIDLQASYVLRRNTKQLILQRMSMEDEKIEDLPYRLGTMHITADGHYMVFQHFPEGEYNRQYDIEFWSAYNWRKLYVLDNDGEGVNIDYPIDLSSPVEILFNRDHSLMAISNNGKAYLYDIDGIFSIK